MAICALEEENVHVGQNVAVSVGAYEQIVFAAVRVSAWGSATILTISLRHTVGSRMFVL